MSRTRAGLAAAAAAAVLAGCSGGHPAPAATAIPPTPSASSTAAAPTSTAPPSPLATAARPAPTPTPALSPRRAAPRPGEGADAATVAAAFATTTWAYDTATDTSPTDAQRRSAALATPTLAAQLRTGAPVAGPGHAWATLAARDGYTATTARIETTPDTGPDTPTTAYRQVVVTITARDDTSWTSKALFPPVVMFIELSRTPGQPWRVAASTSTPL